MVWNSIHLADILTTLPPLAYRVRLFAGNGAVLGSHPISVPDDEHGREWARSMVAGHAVELWDGLRFIESYPAHA